MAKKLAIKKYLEATLNDLMAEKHALDKYLAHHKKGESKTLQLLKNDTAYKELLGDYFSPQNEDLDEWAKAPYKSNPKYPDQMIHKTVSGRYVRSKSEAMIDLFLYTNQIPFRYECELDLGNYSIYPDFTIRHPKTGAIYYWEHFGLMDDSNYKKSVLTKLQTFISNGIIPSINLITTYETQDSPLTSDVIEKIIDHYFL